MPFTTAEKNNMLDALTTPNRIRLHDGPPGAAGTDNELGSATETAAFDAADGGQRELTADVEFTDLGANAEVTHWSVWNDSGPSLIATGARVGGDTNANSEGEYTVKGGTSLLKLSDPA